MHFLHIIEIQFRPINLTIIHIQRQILGDESYKIKDKHVHPRRSKEVEADLILCGVDTNIPGGRE